MSVAALYDIHGNLPALEAVLEEVRSLDVDLIVVGGDIVWGPMPGETLELLRGLDMPTSFIRGNADREVVAGLPADAQEWVAELTAWVADRLEPAQRDFLATLHHRLEVGLPLGATLFCHGSPRRDDENITPSTPDERLFPMLEDVDETVVVCGHTHMQFDRATDAHPRVGRVVNAGSVGMPYEGDPGAYWALIGDDVELRRTSYDFDAAAAEVRATQCPFADEIAAEMLSPTSREAAIAAFEPRLGESAD